jgi:hypothetical protein
MGQSSHSLLARDALVMLLSACQIVTVQFSREVLSEVLLNDMLNSQSASVRLNCRLV